MNKIRKWLDKIPWYTDEIHSILMYLIMGGFTTLINIVTFWLCTYVLNWDYRIANTIAWVASVLLHIFLIKNMFLKAIHLLGKNALRSYIIFRFPLFDLFSGHFSNDSSNWSFIYKWIMGKNLDNVIVLVLNYVFSKWIIFKVKK